ncbi:MAG: DUF2970 domain-containing protein [Oleiphilaceae bacterium]|nr:DUF2970 domain-containing protein [Oleiphilaceae bacterium]
MTDENRQNDDGSKNDSGGTQKEGTLARNKKNPGLLKVIQSVLAGALGVQSNRRYREDFEGSSPFPYIIGGILFGVIFVVTLILIVRWVLASQ